jgi:hypothetical protein
MQVMDEPMPILATIIAGLALRCHILLPFPDMMFLQPPLSQFSLDLDKVGLQWPW